VGKSLPTCAGPTVPTCRHCAGDLRVFFPPDADSGPFFHLVCSVSGWWRVLGLSTRWCPLASPAAAPLVKAMERRVFYPAEAASRPFCFLVHTVREVSMSCVGRFARRRFPQPIPTPLSLYPIPTPLSLSPIPTHVSLSPIPSTLAAIDDGRRRSGWRLTARVAGWPRGWRCGRLAVRMSGRRRGRLAGDAGGWRRERPWRWSRAGAL
jgi:hypothetical protein